MDQAEAKPKFDSGDQVYVDMGAADGRWMFRAKIVAYLGGGFYRVKRNSDSEPVLVRESELEAIR